MTIHPAPKPAGKVKAPKPLKRAFEDAFGSVERVEWVNAMPCAICGVTGWTQNMHTKSRGAGGKACDVVPGCGSRVERGVGIEGCHAIYDTHPWDLPEGTVAKVRALAKELDRQWNERGAA